MDPAPITPQYREGMAAFEAGRSRNDHSYPLGSWEADDFAAGFRAAEMERVIEKGAVV